MVFPDVSNEQRAFFSATKVLHSFKTLGNTTSDTAITSQKTGTLNKVSVEISNLSK
jgi:hypothetical protein